MEVRMDFGQLSASVPSVASQPLRKQAAPCWTWIATMWLLLIVSQLSPPSVESLPLAESTPGPKMYLPDVEEMCRNETTHCPPKAAEFRIANVNTTSATLNWHLVDEGLSRGNVTYIKLHILEVLLWDSYQAQEYDILLEPFSMQYTVHDLRPGTNYSVRLTTYNDNGYHTSIRKTITTEENVSIICEQKHGCAFSGDTARFLCQVRGGPHLSVATESSSSPGWFRTEAVRGGIDVVYAMHSVSRGSPTQRACLTVSAGSKSQKACFSPCIQERVTITCKKSRKCSRRVFGRNATVSCRVTGYPTPNVSWFFNGERISPGNTNPATRGWYIVPHQALHQYRLRTRSAANSKLHTGRVEIHATNGYTNARRSQVIIVTDQPPVRLRHLADSSTVRLGRSHQIECTSQIGLRNSFAWYILRPGDLHKKPIVNGTRGFLIESHGRQSVLMIPLAQSNHQGKYFCEVNNKAGCKKTKSTYVKVDSPFLLEMLSSSNGFLRKSLHEAVTVSCLVSLPSRHDRPVVKWFLNSREIKPQILGKTLSWRVNHLPRYRPLLNQAIFSISTASLTVMDLGKLTCDVSLGKMRQSSTATVMADGVLMVVTNVPRAIKVKRGGTVSFGCTAFSTNRLFAEDIAQVGWLVRSSNHQTSSQLRPVMSLPNVEVQQGSEKSPFGSVIWGNAEVTITNFNEEHVGFYVCRAQGDQKHSPSGHRMQAAVKLRLDGPRPIAENIDLMGD